MGYKADGVPLVVIGGREYDTSSLRGLGRQGAAPVWGPRLSSPRASIASTGPIWSAWGYLRCSSKRAFPRDPFRLPAPRPSRRCTKQFLRGAVRPWARAPRRYSGSAAGVPHAWGRPSCQVSVDLEDNFSGATRSISHRIAQSAPSADRSVRCRER